MRPAYLDIVASGIVHRKRRGSAELVLVSQDEHMASNISAYASIYLLPSICQHIFLHI